MTYQNAYYQMVENINNGMDFNDALDNAAFDLQDAGVMDFNTACDALTADYDEGV